MKNNVITTIRNLALVALGSGLLGSASLRAAPVTFHFSGILDTVGPAAAPELQGAVNAIFHGTYTFDDQLQASDPRPYAKFFTPLTRYHLTVEGTSFELNTTNEGFIYVKSAPDFGDPLAVGSSRHGGFLIAFNPFDSANLGGFEVELPHEAVDLRLWQGELRSGRWDDDDYVHGKITSYRLNSAPSLSVPANVTAEADSAAGKLLSLPIQFNDVDTDSLTLTWTIDGQVVATGALPAGATSDEFTGVFGFGSHLIEVSVADPFAPPVVHSFTVTVQDSQRPSISAAVASPSILNSPNHNLNRIQISAAVSDNVPGARCWIASVTSNEPDNGLGDGDTSNDIQITGEMTVLLRAERSGAGNGRVYTITLLAEDAAGNRSQPKVVMVSVPKGGKAK
jgi:hypothetical protein